MTDKFLVIANPVSGKRKYNKVESEISQLLEHYHLNYHITTTQFKNHATSLAKIGYENGFRKFIAIGGDGTLNEVVNGLIDYPKDSFKVGIIPLGTGNDWIRTHKIKNDLEFSIKIINDNFTKFQDIGEVNYIINESKKKIYFVNVLGGGFDGVVALDVNLEKEQSNSNFFSYYKNLFKNLFKFKSSNLSLNIDDKEIKSKVFSFAIGICKYNGKGLKQNPFANPYDGELDITLINDFNKIEILMNLPLLFNGKFIKNPKIQIFKAKRIFLASDEDVFIEVDGESLCKLPIEIQIIPERIAFYIPQHQS